MATKAYSYIRFSTPEQLKGSSLERQLEASRRYAHDHNLDLDESMQDLGLSGFHGIHRTRGALGGFLKMIEEGKIPKGSYLIIENLDRLSRQDVLTALNLFTSIIDSGITLVTLQDGMEYSKASITDNWAQLIISITYMARAHDESLRKSQRGKSNWIIKRQKAVNGEKKLTARCPAWLRLSDDRKTFIVIADRAEVINLIFDMKLEGKGADRIARELNQMDVWKPVSNRKNKLSGKISEPSWRKSYIIKVLYDNRAVIGEYQPYEKIDGKRVPKGDPIADYYPKIVDESKFYRLQSQLKDNFNEKARSAGRNDKVSNLFGHMAICSTCGYPMQFVNKGNTSKGGQYLICDKELRKIDGGCENKRIHYDLIEKHVLEFCAGLDVKDVLTSGKKQMSELIKYQKREQEILGQISDIESRIEGLLDKAESKTASDGYKLMLEHRAESYRLNRDKLKKELTEIQSEIERLKSSPNYIQDQLKDIKELQQKMKELEDDELLTLRLNLRNSLRRLIRGFRIDTINYTIVVFFKSGLRRLIYMDDDTPTKRDRQL